MSKPSSTLPSVSVTPAPSSPPPSESFFSELDGPAPSLLETSGGEYAWDGAKIDPTALNLVSWKLDVNARAEDGVEKRGFNAISTVLNHPTKKANPLRGSRKPLPPLTQPAPVLTRTPPPAFYDAYLRAVTPLYDAFASQASSSSQPLTGAFEPRPPGQTSVLPSLRAVPEIFFDTDFNLASPSTWSEVVGDAAGPSTLPDRVVDSLSTHLDSLESHLAHEITLRSTSFFSALSNLQDLHSESASCLARISELRESLQEVGAKQARKGLQVIDTQEDLRILRVTENGVKEVGELEELLKVTRGLVEHGDWAAGLGCLSDVARWWGRHGLGEGESLVESPDPTPSRSRALPLATLPALATLPEAVADLNRSIAEQLQASLASLLLSILSADSNQPFDTEKFKTSVEPMVEGLARCGQLGSVEGVFKEVVTLGIREGSRKHLPVSPPDDDGVEDGRPIEMRGANLASALKAMDHARYLLLSTQMYSAMLARLRLAQTMGEQLNILLESARSLRPLTITSFVPTTSSDTPKAATVLTLDVSEVVGSACELANLRASKILTVRSEQHAALQLTEFVEIFKENWQFVVATETLAKRMIVSLRGVTATQARTFLIAYHSFRLTRSAKLVEEEQWAQIDVTAAVQHVVNILIEAAVTDPAECFIPSPPAEANGMDHPSKSISVEDKSFFVVKATAESLVLLGDYLKIVINLELVVTDVMARIIEFLKLKAQSFNSRTCQVVLGAGAMRSAGLKNITAKHLALASQSLSIIVALIPYIREFVRRHLSPKQAVMLTEFDKLKRDYQEHQNEIHAKLVAIMSDRLAVHVGSLRDIDWEATPDRETARPYAEMLVKETTTLHKVLSKYLSLQTVESVMSEVLSAIVNKLSEEYGKVELKSEDAKKRMVQDAALLSSRLGSLAQAGKSVETLEILVKEKPLPRKAMSETVKGFMRRSNSKDSPKAVQGESGGAVDPSRDEEENDVGEDDVDGPMSEVQAEPEEGRLSEEQAIEPNGRTPDQALEKAAAPNDGSTEGTGQPVPLSPAEPNGDRSTARIPMEAPDPTDIAPPSDPPAIPPAAPDPLLRQGPPMVTAHYMPPTSAAPEGDGVAAARIPMNLPASTDVAQPPDPPANPPAAPDPLLRRSSPIARLTSLSPHNSPISPLARLASPPLERALPALPNHIDPSVPPRAASPPAILTLTSPPPRTTSFSPLTTPQTPISLQTQRQVVSLTHSPISPTPYAVRQPRVSLANRLRGVMTRQASEDQNGKFGSHNGGQVMFDSGIKSPEKERAVEPVINSPEKQRLAERERLLEREVRAPEKEAGIKEASRDPALPSTQTGAAHAAGTQDTKAEANGPTSADPPAKGVDAGSAIALDGAMPAPLSHNGSTAPRASDDEGLAGLTGHEPSDQKTALPPITPPDDSIDEPTSDGPGKQASLERSRIGATVLKGVSN